ncbi:MAG: HEAT repeat domain-containing protein [Bacteroidota bacterium]
MQQETVALKQSMMLAMLDNRSVSKRIQAVSYSEDISTPDEEVLEALIDRLHFDGSVNVRLAAAEALSKYSENEKVKNAFIKSLTNEKNPNIQITVIQFLVDIQDKRALAPMQQLLEQTETPDYVKEQVSAGLQQLI